MHTIIAKHYELLESIQTKEIVEHAMEDARKLIPQGNVATYIPELGKANPDQLGICIYPLKGDKICLGDYNARFTIQSVSKIIMFIVAMEVCGRKKVFEKVGAEPSGEAFNSLIELDTRNSRPFNPLINSGALAVCGLLIREISFQDMLRYTRKVLDDPDVSLDEAVFDSEMKTCARNKSIAYLLESKGIIEGDVDDILKFYTKCCSMSVTAEGLANLGRILANDGVCSMQKHRYMSSATARIAKTLMLTCGMYDGSGAFAITVGIPSKSGVGGGLLSVSDKRAGIGVFSPALDDKGNSIAGIRLLRDIANKLRLNLFFDPEWDEESEDSVPSEEITAIHF